MDALEADPVGGAGNFLGAFPLPHQRAVPAAFIAHAAQQLLNHRHLQFEKVIP